MSADSAVAGWALRDGDGWGGDGGARYAGRFWRVALVMGEGRL